MQHKRRGYLYHLDPDFVAFKWRYPIFTELIVVFDWDEADLVETDIVEDVNSLSSGTRTALTNEMAKLIKDRRLLRFLLKEEHTDSINFAQFSMRSSSFLTLKKALKLK